MNNILKKLDEAIASPTTNAETKKLLIELKQDLIQAKTQAKILKILAIIIKVITGLFDG